MQRKDVEKSTILLSLTGSRLYGIDNEDSDYDYKGICKLRSAVFCCCLKNVLHHITHLMNFLYPIPSHPIPLNLNLPFPHFDPIHITRP